MKQVSLQYSNDDGSTFSTALTIDAHNLRVYQIVETDTGATSVTGRKFERTFTYFMIDIETERDAFDPSVSGGSEANWLALQSWCKAKTRRLYNADTTNYPTFDGYNNFNSSTNTVYLNLVSQEVNFLDADKFGATGKKRRWMVLQLQSREAQ